jgi:hypothetical protein
VTEDFFSPLGRSASNAPSIRSSFAFHRISAMYARGVVVLEEKMHPHVLCGLVEGMFYFIGYATKLRSGIEIILDRAIDLHSLKISAQPKLLEGYGEANRQADDCHDDACHGDGVHGQDHSSRHLGGNPGPRLEKWERWAGSEADDPSRHMTPARPGQV